MFHTKTKQRGIEDNLSKLKAKGIIERIGAAKGGYWKIKIALNLN
jgi:predicted HTH transcriptional regulator